MTVPNVIWSANPGPQAAFLSSTAFEALYGGAAGGGKSDALLAGALRYIHVPRYRALLLRRTHPELERSLIPRSFQIYKAAHGRPIMGNTAKWIFPSGAIIEFGHLQHEHDVHKYLSAEYQYIGFDELTSFTETQYIFLQSRLRGGGDIPKRVRAGTNPGGEGHEWVQKRFSPWLDKNSPIKAKAGEKLWCVMDGDFVKWVDEGTQGAISRAFFPAFLKDNPYIEQGYRDVLGSLDRVTRMRYLEGDWDVHPAAGMYYRRDWFELIPEGPLEPYQRVRRWDLASTHDGGDWTVGVLMARMKNGPPQFRPFVIEDVVRVRLRPDGVMRLVRKTAENDPDGTEIVMPQDPGQAGVHQMEAYTNLLEGFNVRFERETGDKVTRQEPFSAQCEAKRVQIVKGEWNEAFLRCLEAFPDETMHDDDVDAAAGAFNAFNLGKSTIEYWQEAGL